MPEVLRTVTNTSTGAQDVTTSGNPAALISMLSTGVTDDTAAANATLSIGFSDGTNSRYATFGATDGVGSASTLRGSGNKLAARATSTSLSFPDISLTSFGTNKFTMNIDAASGNAYQMLNLVFNEDEISSATVGEVQANGSAATVSSLSFEPDLILFTGCGNTAKGNANAGIIHFGVAINDVSATPTQRGLSFGDVHAQGNAVVNMKVHTGTTGGQVYNGSEAWAGTISNITSSGFTISDTTNDIVFWIAIKFVNSSPDLALFSITTPTGTDAYAETSPGFTPSVGLIALADATAFDTITTANDGISITAFDGTTTGALAISSQDGAATMNADSTAATSLYLADGSGALFDQDFSAFDSSGWDFTYVANPGSARRGWGLALGNLEAAAGGNVGMPLSMAGGMNDLRGGMQ